MSAAELLSQPLVWADATCLSRRMAQYLQRPAAFAHSNQLPFWNFETVRDQDATKRI